MENEKKRKDIINETERKYLNLPKKIAYGSGDAGGNFFYTLVTSFMMLYLTDIAGLSAGIVGTLMMVSKLFDGITDIFFGRLIDKTHSKMGKARPWMFFSAFPLAICMFMMFSIPDSMGDTAQYIYFFILYTAANALFYTANNISYSTLSALITKNNGERVTLGTFRYTFAVIGGVFVNSATSIMVSAFGGGAKGWSMAALVFAIGLLIINTIASLSSKEVLEETEQEAADNAEQTGLNFIKALKIIITNKYYLILLAIYLVMYGTQGVTFGVGAYYCQYVLGNTGLLGVMSMASMTMIIGLAFNPMLVKRFGMYKVNLVSQILGVLFTAVLMFFGYQANFAAILIITAVRAVITSPLAGSLNALVAEVAQNVYLKKGVHAEGMMFSCSSFGIKVGTGIGTAVAGWLLTLAGYSAEAAAQSMTVLSMIKFIYFGTPLIFAVLQVICLWKMKVVEENKALSL